MDRDHAGANTCGGKSEQLGETIPFSGRKLSTMLSDILRQWMNSNHVRCALGNFSAVMEVCSYDKNAV